MISFTVFGDIQPAHRPRASVGKRKGKLGEDQYYPKMHNDERHTSWMETVKLQALGYRPRTLLDGPLALKVTFYLLRPMSAKKRRFPHTKPDLSNLVKAVEDALNKVIWTDDSRIVSLAVEKRFGDPCRVDIQVEEIA